MSNIYYLKNTIDNIECWFYGFCNHMHNHINEEVDMEMHQLVTLYQMQIDEIIAHAKNLLCEIEEGCVSSEK